MCDVYDGFFEWGDGRQRKKLWELSTRLHCSIIGTCLTMGDLRRIERRLKIEPQRDGTDFHVHGNFVLWAGSARCATIAGGEPASADGLPGLAKAGIFGESGNREDLKDGRDKDGNAGFYVSLEQMVYREPDTLDQGLTPWAVAAFLPRQSINEVPAFFGAGLVYKGPIPTRDDDAAAIGFFYGKLSTDIDPGGSEKILEINYTVQLTPWFYVRPDLQLVFDPAGVGSADTAVVFGGEIGITF